MNIQLNIVTCPYVSR